MPCQPFEPEPLEALRARYRLALTPVYDVQAIYDGLVPAPSGNRQHVFDCESGFRLIVSVDRYPNGLLAIHISASVRSDELRRELQRRYRDNHALIAAALTDWRAISDDVRIPHLVGVTDYGVPHWMIELTD